MGVDTTRTRRYTLAVDADRLKEARQAKGWTQADLAAATGNRVSRGSIGHMETGRHPHPIPAVLYVLAEALHVEEGWLRGE